MLTLVFLEIKFQIFHSNIATLDFVVLLFIQKCGVLREISPLTGDAIPIHVLLYGGFFGLMMVSSAVFPVLRILLFVPYVILVLLATLICLTGFLWIKNQGTLTNRIIFSVVIVLSSIFTWWMFHWNWIGSFYI